MKVVGEVVLGEIKDRKVLKVLVVLVVLMVTKDRRVKLVEQVRQFLQVVLLSGLVQRTVFQMVGVSVMAKTVDQT